jgi:hypothetical protein
MVPLKSSQQFIGFAVTFVKIILIIKIVYIVAEIKKLLILGGFQNFISFKMEKRIENFVI